MKGDEWMTSVDTANVGVYNASMVIGRREWVRTTTSLGLGAALGCGDGTSDPVFTLGVASGDPLEDRVILWTRLLNPLAPLEGEHFVEWEVARDESFSDVVVSGEVLAQPDAAHTVHVDATGLAPGEVYFYRFHALGDTSPVGRTRTAPAADAMDPLRMAVASCQDYRDGYYTAYSDLVAQAPDLVAFLGDYIYENDGGDIRLHRGGECVTLDDYRDRYAQYRSDPLLRAAHAWCPWIVTWDDHEVDNNWHGDLPEPEGITQGEEFLERRRVALQAFFEHMPIRVETMGTTRRQLSWGQMVRFLVGDARFFRDPRDCQDVGTCTGPDGTPRLLGESQEAWLHDAVRSSTARHTLFVQSIMLTDISFGSDALRNEDQWDGFAAERQRLLDVVSTSGIEGFGVVSGDRHAALFADLHAVADDASTRRIGWECTCNSISSDGLPPRFEIGFKEGWADLEWVQYAQAERRGYALLDFDADGVDVIYREVETVLEPDAAVSEGARFRAER